MLLYSAQIRYRAYFKNLSEALYIFIFLLTSYIFRYIALSIFQGAWGFYVASPHRIHAGGFREQEFSLHGYGSILLRFVAHRTGRRGPAGVGPAGFGHHYRVGYRRIRGRC